MSIIHVGVNDNKNKFVCEDGLEDKELQSLTADQITGTTIE